MKNCFTHENFIRKKSLIVFLCIVTLAITLAGCIKDYSDKDSEIIDTSKGSNGIFTLPVNLNKYNLVSTGGTKSTDTSYYINADSLIDWSKTRELILAETGYVYTQVPFKSNEEGIYGAFIPTGAKNGVDSIVQIKCFYILEENCKLKTRSEYMVMMIPSKYNETNHIAMDYSYLNKPNFSGIIIFSSKDGTLLKSEILSEGIVRESVIYTASEANALKQKTKSSSIYIDNSDGTLSTVDQLSEVYVTPSKSGQQVLREWMDGNLSGAGTHILVNHIQSNMDGTERGGGGNSTPIKEITYSITITYTGCKSGTEVIQTTRNTTSSITCPQGSDGCLFFSYEKDGYLYSTDKTITVSVTDSDIDFTARYVSESNGDCYLIAKMLADPTLNKGIADMLAIATFATIEHGFSIDSGGERHDAVGTETNIQLNYYQFGLANIHTHPNGACIFSWKDLFNYCHQIRNNPSSWSSFVYGVITGGQITVLKVKNWPMFKAFLDKNMDETDFDKYFLDFFTNYEEMKNNSVSSDEYFPGANNLLSKMGLTFYNAIVDGEYEAKNNIMWWRMYSEGSKKMEKLDCYINTNNK